MSQVARSLFSVSSSGAPRRSRVEENCEPGIFQQRLVGSTGDNDVNEVASPSFHHKEFAKWLLSQCSLCGMNAPVAMELEISA